MPLIITISTCTRVILLCFILYFCFFIFHLSSNRCALSLAHFTSHCDCIDDYIDDDVNAATTASIAVAAVDDRRLASLTSR